MFQPLADKLERIYRTNGRQLMACAIQVTGCPHRAEDAIHEAFSRLFAMRSHPRQLRAYVFRSVRNAAIDLVRKTEAQNTAANGRAHLYAGLNAAGAVSDPEQNDGTHRLDEAMRGLEDQERAIIVLRLHANLNMREVAEVLGQPRGTVSSTYYRALRKLRDRLGDL